MVPTGWPETSVSTVPERFRNSGEPGVCGVVVSCWVGVAGEGSAKPPGGRRPPKGGTTNEGLVTAGLAGEAMAVLPEVLAGGGVAGVVGGVAGAVAGGANGGGCWATTERTKPKAAAK